MLKYFAFLILLLFQVQISYADTLPAPSGRVLLTVSGKIELTNVKMTAELDYKQLKSPPVHIAKTYTDWTEGEVIFEGFLLRDLIKYLKATGDSIHASALNDYQIEIPFSDANNYPVLIAYKKNGVDLTVRTKGPLWVIYPSDTPGEMREHNGKMIWQLVKLEFR